MSLTPAQVGSTSAASAQIPSHWLLQQNGDARREGLGLQAERPREWQVVQAETRG